MKVFFLIAVVSTCLLYGISSGSPHDAWSDWIIEHCGKKQAEPEEIVRNEVEESFVEDNAESPDTK